MMRRREFLSVAALTGGALALDGCRGTFGTGAPAVCDRVPYGETIGDRLWMWGHHRESFKGLKGLKEQYNLPFDTRIDMAPACARMNIPGCFVVRWLNLPTTADMPEYMKQFKDMKRVGFSITDSAVDTFEEKVRLGLEYADRMPNLTTLIMDDFWACKDLTRPLSDVVAVKERMLEKNLRLGIVIYSDRNQSYTEKTKPVLDLCDEITAWIWTGKNVDMITDQLSRLREAVGPEKSILLGQYMWDFGARKPMPGATMERQLAQTSELLRQRIVNGVIFHCTPLVDMNLDAVRVSKSWIDANASRKWGG